VTQPDDYNAVVAAFDVRLNDWQKKLMQVVQLEGPPGPMGPQGPPGRNLVLPPGDYTAEEINKMLQLNYDGIELKDGGFHISGSGPDTVVRGGYIPTAKAHPSAYKPGKKPQDRKKPNKKWTDETVVEQNELMERAIKLLEQKTLLIQVLEAQVDDVRRENVSLKIRIDGLTTRMEEHDDRINWLET
jgi:hypothetical protein